MRSAPQQEKRFETFFKDPLYLQYKNHLYNFRLRRQIIRQSLAGKNHRRALELGCGISPMLEPSRGIVQTDLSWQALSFLNSLGKKAEARPVACDGIELPFSGNSFDAVICSEVIEHVENDGQLLREIYRVLRSGGELYLTCPIHQRLFGFDDEFVGHFRRYEVPQLIQRLGAAGFTDFQVRPILGRLEKFMMEKVTRIFASLKKGETKSGSFGGGLRVLAWVLFPFYVLFNQILAFFVRREAQASPLERVVTICLICQKTA